ncbi:MAG: serine/threonine-protein kinase [Myxococcales bacterium]
MKLSDRPWSPPETGQGCPTQTLESVPGTRPSGDYRPPADSLRDLPAQAPQTLDSLCAQVEREEHAGNVLRMRQAAAIGAWLWPCFFATDWLMASFVTPTSWVSYAGLRLAGWIGVIAGYLVLKLPPHPSKALVLASELMVYGTTAAAVSFMCLLQSGLDSPYAAGIPVIFTVRAAFLAVPWRRALPSTVVCALTYPLVMLGAAVVRGDLVATLSDKSELAVFLLYNALIWTTMFATLVGGNATWALRRQAFEARSVGRYRLVRQIARGGMGEVWIAHHITLRRNVALKLLRSDRLSDVALKRFEREVQATCELTHPNTVRVFDYGATDDGLWYYAMELLEGLDLASSVQRDGPMAEKRALQLMLQVSGALAEAHARNIVHRDIKPENIFLCQTGGNQEFAKVLDFGIAKRSDGDQPITHSDRLLGTLAYLSPEIALGGQADARTDVYGLGGVLYYALVGGAPFDGVPASQLVAAHISQTPALPSVRLQRGIDPRLEEIVMRCLEKKPTERFAHSGELYAALANLT